MIAVDTNLLVYAHRVDSAFHEQAKITIEGLARAKANWAIPWPCAHEFVAITTNPRIYKTPTPLDEAFGTLRDLAALPNLSWLSEADGYLDWLETLALGAKTRGGAIHDTRIAAICLFHGVTELWSADRDFSRFASLKVRNPLGA